MVVRRHGGMEAWRHGVIPSFHRAVDSLCIALVLLFICLTCC